MIFYLGRNELWARVIFAAGTSPTIAGSVHIKHFFRWRSGRTTASQACKRQGPAMVVVAGNNNHCRSLPYVLMCRNSTPGSTGGCVAGSSAAYENQA